MASLAPKQDRLETILEAISQIQEEMKAEFAETNTNVKTLL